MLHPLVPSLVLTVNIGLSTQSKSSGTAILVFPDILVNSPWNIHFTRQTLPAYHLNLFVPCFPLFWLLLNTFPQSGAEAILRTSKSPILKEM